MHFFMYMNFSGNFKTVGIGCFILIKLNCYVLVKTKNDCLNKCYPKLKMIHFY